MKLVRLCALGTAGCLATLIVGAALLAQDVPPMAGGYYRSELNRSYLPAQTGADGDYAVFATDAPGRTALCAAEDELPMPPVPPSAAKGPQYDGPLPDDQYADDDPYTNQLWADTVGFCGACCEAGLIVGVEGTFLAPMGEPKQEVVLTNLNSDRVFRGASHPGLGSGVRTWVGLQRDGTGFRAVYWHFADETIHDEPVVPQEGQTTFHEAFRLKANAIDIELTHGLCWGSWRVGASFGGRWAELERSATAIGRGTLGNGVELYGLAAGSNDIEGPGFTFSIDGRRPLGCCCGWNLYWGYRGSVLWVCPAAYAIAEGNAVTADAVGTAYARNEAFANADGRNNIFISEVRLGIQYERCLACIPGVAFFRIGMEYQHWTTGDAFAESESFAFLQGGPPAFGGRVDAAADAHDGDLDLLGFVVGAGFTW